MLLPNFSRFRLKRWLLLFLTLSLPLTLFVACSTKAQVQSMMTKAGSVKIDDVAKGLEHPWGLAFLPDGRMLVTERSGQLRIADMEGNISEPVAGTPEVFARGQGGLLDVELDPDFETNKLVYLTFSEPGPENTASTAIGRGVWEDDRIQNFTVLFSQEPKLEGPNHFGGRIVFAPDGTLFVTTGERFKFDPAQELSNHLGTVIRINPDGTIPADNPFMNQANAENEIWSYGHRNIEAAAIDPATDKLWIAEMGPLGGDEFNQPEAGKNYGWPEVSWGKNYDGTGIPDPPTRPEFTDAALHWTPVISPSGMIFYTGDVFPEWKGSALIGGLSSTAVVRVEVDGDQASEVERLDMGARIREVVQGPDGMVYVLTDQDDGNIWRISPLKAKASSE